ncbi:hypothetical protein D1007_37181 [Hordeum vulgare]|nr:hypothetical protein D1007_37181 [Hordeum vulgare]
MLVNLQPDPENVNKVAKDDDTDNMQVEEVIGVYINCMTATENPQLEGLENLFKYTSKHMELKSDKWIDLNVTTWKREEHINNTPQKDGSSCGLSMLNYMEYFTEDNLSDTPEQVHMTNFRTKLAVILVDSELNDDDIRNRNFDDDETNMDPTDCMIVERPPNKPKASNSSSQVELSSQS